MRQASSASQKRFAALLPLAVLCVTPALRVGAEEVIAPRHAEYRIAWNGIAAGSATVDVSPDPIGGAAGYIVEASVRTNEAVDVLWKFRARARTSFLLAGFTPVHFLYDAVANAKREVAWIDVVPGTTRARSVYVKKGRRSEFDVDIADGVDPITAAFRAMGASAEPGDRLSYLVFTGKKHFRVDLRIVKEESIVVPAGRFAALRIRPEVWKLKETMQRDKRLRDATLWVTRDSAHTPLRIRSEVLVGAITLDLVSVQLRPTDKSAAATDGAVPRSLPVAAPNAAVGR